jgi:hypothetical protein
MGNERHHVKNATAAQSAGGVVDGQLLTRQPPGSTLYRPDPGATPFFNLAAQEAHGRRFARTQARPGCQKYRATAMVTISPISFS